MQPRAAGATIGAESAGSTVRNRREHRVLDIRQLAHGSFVLRFERNGRSFEPGQWLNVGTVDSIDMREYSIYSGAHDEWFEILVKHIENGLVSRRLHRLKPADRLAIDGPFGFFTIDQTTRETAHFLFIATGTGLSPFRSFVRSYPTLDYRILHGIRYNDETCEQDIFDPSRYIACVSREPAEPAGFHRGRVTDWLRQHPVDPDTRCYLCGNCDMIYEAHDILLSQGIASTQLFAEVYF